MPPVNFHLHRGSEAELQQLRATVGFLMIALACATQPTPTPTLAGLLSHWLKPRPLSRAELDELACVWTLGAETPPR